MEIDPRAQTGGVNSAYYRTLSAVWAHGKYFPVF
jgi:hypothetical protein